ncbi:MAG: winged helix DNA-binding protein [Candidatus Nitrosocosmicus sp.]
MIDKFYEFTLCVNKAHALFLKLIERELSINKIRDLNASQALLIKNISEEIMNVGQAQRAGYYTVTNITYNLDKLATLGYVMKMENNVDLRSTLVKLTEKGLKVLQIINGVIMSQSSMLKSVGIDDNDMDNITKILHELHKIFMLSS